MRGIRGNPAIYGSELVKKCRWRGLFLQDFTLVATQMQPAFWKGDSETAQVRVCPASRRAWIQVNRLRLA